MVEPKRVIHPMFPITPGLQDIFTYGEEAEVDMYAEHDKESITEVLTEDSKLMDEGDYEQDDSPSIPDILDIVSQTIRTGAGGEQVVDVVIEVEDVDGVAKYDIRVARN